MSADSGPNPVSNKGQDDWTERLLCSDGACIGVVGADGRCKLCQRAQPAALRADPDADDALPADALVMDPVLFGADAPTADPTAMDPVLAGIKVDSPGALAEVAAAGTQAPAADDFAARELCADGSCTGVLGADGRCKLCGRAGR